MMKNYYSQNHAKKTLVTLLKQCKQVNLSASGAIKLSQNLGT